MSFRIDDLFTHPHEVDRIANWIHAEFWADKEVHSPESLARLLRLALQPNAIPLSLLAIVDGEPVGTVNLVENDDELRTHLRPWLAALYVVPDHRGRGIGSALGSEIASRAAALGFQELYLGTDNPGFYERLGATFHEQATDEITIMRLSLAP